MACPGRATREIANPAQVRMFDDVEVGRRVAPHLRVAFEVDDAASTRSSTPPSSGLRSPAPGPRPRAARCTGGGRPAG
ncbi:hypothetical protein [Cellulomonas sp. ATA003]|uniref:hypothetical protein n=1 Tax=Cellulomonas sp. ATA003 TaxID=3073064 RepID=UPI0028730BCF|nr:hypothetical protein [Cellulomonas sp. ATA003]WNB85472.1 hypothetical protein REH70_18190 [Cellulomonas sp. ATA003]